MGRTGPARLSEVETPSALFNEPKVGLSSRWSEANRHNDAGDKKTFPIDEGDKEELRFFKIPIKGLNKTTARAEVVKLQADPERAAAWDQRPAEAIQKEFYKFFGVKVPRGLTYSAADIYIGKHQLTLDSQQLSNWSSYQSILNELLDKDTRDSYYIKKPSVATIRAAIAALRQSGVSLSKLEGDLEIVAQKLIELQPELER